MSTGDDAGGLPTCVTDDGIATIRLNRPSHLNKLTPEDLAEFVEICDGLDRDRGVRVVVLTGSGRVFSAGYDLGDIARRVQGEVSSSSEYPSFESVIDRVEALAAPTICHLNGGVYGGATDLALCCDFRIGVDTAEMFMPAARLGLHYYPGGMRRFVSRLGLAAAKKLFLTARKIEAAEMVRIGYLDEAVPASEIDQRVAELAAALARNAPVATRGMKATLNEIARDAFDHEAARRRYQDSLAGEELREGAAAFAEKRLPRYN